MFFFKIYFYSLSGVSNYQYVCDLEAGLIPSEARKEHPVS